MEYYVYLSIGLDRGRILLLAAWLLAIGTITLRFRSTLFNFFKRFVISGAISTVTVILVDRNGTYNSRRCVISLSRDWSGRDNIYICIIIGIWMIVGLLHHLLLLLKLLVLLISLNLCLLMMLRIVCWRDDWYGPLLLLIGGVVLFLTCWSTSHLLGNREIVLKGNRWWIPRMCVTLSINLLLL